MTRAFPEKDDCVVPSTPAIDPLDYVFDSCGVPSPPTSAFSNSAAPSVIPQPTPVGSGGCLVGYLVVGEITDVQAASDVGNPGAFHRYKAEDCHGCLSLDDWTVAINDVNLSGEDELGSSMPPAAIGDKCLLGYWCATKIIVIWPATLSVEWGVLRSAPNSTPTASVTLVPCDKDGAVITDADDVEVLIRNDRSEVVLSGRGWVVPDEILKIVGTIFSFIRLREAVTIDESSVEGVLVGEGPGEMSVEWGHPYSAAPTSPSTTIDLVTCDENGDALDDPEDITVYIRNDQSEVNIDSRGWDQDTLLSFVRSVENDDGVAGVLVGEGQPAGVGSADAGGSFTIHYSYSGTGVSFPEQETFWTLGGSLNSFIQIALDVRMCEYDLPIGDHPGNTEARTNGGFAGNGIASWLGDDDAWLDLSYTVHDETGTIVATGVEAISGFHLEARVAVSGDLDIRAVKDADWPLLSCVIAGAVWRKSYPAAPGTIEVGSGGCHDDTTWGDGVWEPPA